MSVRPEEAEEYELPQLDRTSHHDGIASADTFGQDGLDDGETSEHDRLLGEDERKPRLGDDGEQAPLFRSSIDDDVREENVGKGTKVEALIARSVPSTDDPTLPTLTLRVLVLGSFFCILGASASTVFYFKSNAPSFSSYIVILATYPLGHLMANERFVPRNKHVLGINLNPGPFNIKEAMLVSSLSSSGAASAYAADILAILDLYYNRPLGFVPSIVLLLTTQCIGFGLAGMLYSVLVARPSMYWPSTLVIVQLFNTLYGTPTASASRSNVLLTRKRLLIFVLVFVGTFLYQFLPMLLFPTLTSVAVLCLINNQSWWMRTLGGAYSGLGMFNFGFDWSSISASNPLYTPYWALGNYFGGLIGMIWIVTPIILLTNFWNARDFPSPTSASLFNSTYGAFDVTSVLKPDLSLDEEAWETAKPLLLTPYFALTYGLSFVALTSIITHVWIWHRHEIREALSAKSELNDTHNKLMRSYLPVPHSWYLIILAINLAAAILMVMTSPLQLPVWGLLLSLAIAAVFLIPIGVVSAVSNTTIGLNVLTEFVAGLLMPGKPIGNVTFKCFGYMAMSQALSLVEDLKLGWYASIPPREMFITQIIGTILGALTNYVTLQSVLTTKRDYLNGTAVDPTGQWTGRRPRIFFSASVIWGAVSPRRFFAGKYQWLFVFFPLGAIIPVLLFWASRRWPNKKLHKVCLPIIAHGGALIPEYPTNIILMGAATAVFVNGFVAKRYPSAHSKFVYVVSSGLDAGTSICALTIYLLFGVLTQWNGPTWWGNSSIDTEHCKPGS